MLKAPGKISWNVFDKPNFQLLIKNGGEK